MAENGYKNLISYKLAQIAFDLGWDFVLEEKHQREGGYNEKLLQKGLNTKDLDNFWEY